MCFKDFPKSRIFSPFLALFPQKCCKRIISSKADCELAWLGARAQADLSICHVCAVLSRVWLFVTPRTVARQDPLSMGTLQARVLKGVAMPSSRGSSNPGIQSRSPALQAIYRLCHQGSPKFIWLCQTFSCGVWDLGPWSGIKPWAPALGA